MRILAIDLGTVRTGLAVSDPYKIIATALDTVTTMDLWPYLKKYLATEDVDTIVLGEPRHLDGSLAQTAPHVHLLAEKIKQDYPLMVVEFQDERFTSVEAKQAILASGVSKKKRQDKGLVDRVAAVIILQTYMEKQRSV